MTTQLSKSYAEAENKLTASNFKMEIGNPLVGVRFKNKDQYAFVLRNQICEFNYQTYFYDIIAEV